MRIMLILLSLMGFPAAHAGVYRWVDEDGTVHFSDKAHQDEGAERIEIPEVNSAQSVQVESAAEVAAGEVVMYSASWCGYCDRARAYFQAHDIPFEEYDVENSRKGRRDYQRMDGESVPIILVGDYKMVGFSADRFARLYQPR